ncbi:MAG: hypothetical protein QOJ74_2611, partial [Ilumatobacteraceae bacterium]|nr:hypothetical protein [Ilumatobacteraceae bacterium]
MRSSTRVAFIGILASLVLAGSAYA